jgi:hypothetical protein
VSSDEQTIVPSVPWNVLAVLLTVARPAGSRIESAFLGAASASTPGALRRVEAFSRRAARPRLRGRCRCCRGVSMGGRRRPGDFPNWRENSSCCRRRASDAGLVRNPRRQGRHVDDSDRDDGSFGDAVGAGLVASLARPGRQRDGFDFLGPQIYAKQLELSEAARASRGRGVDESAQSRQSDVHCANWRMRLGR